MAKKRARDASAASLVDEWLGRSERGDLVAESPGKRSRNDWLHAGWWDATVGAGHWASDPLMRPEEAAALLAGFNPRTAGDDWDTHTTDYADPDALNALRKWCATQAAMPLSNWINAARAAGKHVHPWASDYLDGQELARNDPLLKSSNERLGKRYYLQCLRLGYVFDGPSLRGVSDAARALGLTRQTLTEPLKAYLAATAKCPERRPR